MNQYQQNTESADNLIAKAHKSAKEADTLRKFVSSVAKSALSKKTESTATLVQIGEHCRQIGAHDEAARLFERIVELNPDVPNAVQLRDILSGEPVKRSGVKQGPVPFVQLDQFLADDVCEKLMRQAVSDLERFDDAGVYSSKTDVVRNSLGRRGKVLNFEWIAPYKEVFWPELRSALRTQPILSRLGDPDLSFQRMEFQVTNYGEGEYFGRHFDDNIEQHRNRKVSYVYYFRRSPNSFIGGDLLLYDYGAKVDGAKQRPFTRIRPKHNSIVFFPSSCLHEVLPTFVESGKREDGRFSINGWLLNDISKSVLSA